MRSPLTETIRRVQGMIEYVRDNLSTDEYMLYLDLLAPEPASAVVAGKKRKKRGPNKSPRASSLQKQLQVTGKGTGNGHCVFEVTGGDGLRETCDATANDPIHDQSFGYAGYHEFQAAGS